VSGARLCDEILHLIDEALSDNERAMVTAGTSTLGRALASSDTVVTAGFRRR
jgi:hypothetical protein